MSDEPQANAPVPEDGDPFARLRDLLLATDLIRLDTLEEKAARPLEPEDVAAVLPEAVSRCERQDDVLSDVLTSTVERSLEESVQRNPKVLAEAIFPIIGPAIRRSISQTLTDLVEGINRTVEHSFTVKGLMWRLEAKRARRPFAEIVLSKSFRYRVEQVFLVHRETGLMLEQALYPGAPRWEPDLVSSMLGAIQDFMSDSFTEGGRDAQLEQVEIASGFLLLAPGPLATVAAWVRGTPPASVRDSLQRAVEAVHQRCGKDLSRFDGDTSTFVVARPLLEDCFDEQASGPPKKKSSWPLWVIGATLLVGVLALIARSHNAKTRAETLRRDVRNAIESTPGYVVQSIGSGTPLPVQLLIDPRAEPLTAVLERAHLEDTELEISSRSFLSAEPAIALARLEARFQCPPTARWELNADVLVVFGRVDESWVKELRAALRWLEGIGDVDLSNAEVMPR